MTKRIVYADAELWCDERAGQNFVVYAAGAWWVVGPFRLSWKRREPAAGRPVDGHRVDRATERVWLRFFGVPIGAGDG